MPNVVHCTLVIIGSPDDVRNCLASIGSPGSEDEDARLFDFDRVIPLPRKYRARADVLNASDEVPRQVVVSAWGTSGTLMAPLSRATWPMQGAIKHGPN